MIEIHGFVPRATAGFQRRYCITCGKGRTATIHGVVRKPRQTKLSKETELERLRADNQRLGKIYRAFTDQIRAALHDSWGHGHTHQQYVADVSRLRKRAETAEAEVKRLTDRLQIDPSGSDKIDELEQALQFQRHASESALPVLRICLGGTETDLEAIVEDAEVLKTHADAKLHAMIDGIRSVAALRLENIRAIPIEVTKS